MFHHYTNNNQYALLADALLHGSVTLDLPVPDELAALDNPYNFQDRYAIGNDTTVPIFWDYAFYQGKYYCYFGVVPALLLYIPFQLLSGTALNTSWAVWFLGVLFVITSSLLVIRLVRRYFPDVATPATTCIALLFMFAGANVCYLGYVAAFYSVAILGSLVCTSLGLWFWLGARREATLGKHAAKQSCSLSNMHILLGSFCMALNFGCRPQFMLACFLAIPMFWREIRHERLLFSVRGLGSTVAAFAPFVVVILPLLGYNYLRFGSVFDFGSNYNLTGFDMANYDTGKKRNLYLLFGYLLQAPSLTSHFPFLQVIPFDPDRFGWAPNEPMFGGYFWLVPHSLLIFTFVIPGVYRSLKARGLRGLYLLCLFFSAFVLYFDLKHAGITQRYFSDFGLYIMLATCMAFFCLLAGEKQPGANSSSRAAARAEARSSTRVRLCLAFAVLALLVAAALGTASFFSSERYESIQVSNPQLYQALEPLYGFSLK